MQNLKWVLLISLLVFAQKSWSQGPPITSDKAIMLSANSWIIKTLTEVNQQKNGTFVKAPLMLHYLPTSNSLVAVHLPFVHYNFNDGASGQTFGDMEIMLKYQFYRKDGMGKTFRIAAKTIQKLPTGKKLAIRDFSEGYYQNYLGIIAGYETIKYGISNELGYNIVPSGDTDELRYKLGFGLPLLKSTYPVKQINLYFEYQNSWFTTLEEFMMLYAQGIQYAKGQWTIEAAVQFPLIQTYSGTEEKQYSLFFGSRYVF